MSYLKSYAVAIGSLLAGAAFVHHLYKPSLEIPIAKEPTAAGTPSQGAH